MFKKNEHVVKVISIYGSKTATVNVVESVKNGVVRLVDSTLMFDNTNGKELDAAFAGSGISCEIVPFDVGEASRLGL